jgi:hypothetical protein
VTRRSHAQEGNGRSAARPLAQSHSKIEQGPHPEFRQELPVSRLGRDVTRERMIKTADANFRQRGRRRSRYKAIENNGDFERARCDGCA